MALLSSKVTRQADLEAWKAIHGSTAKDSVSSMKTFEYLIAGIQHRWLACNSQLMRTHCPFSCFIISNFPKKDNCKEKKLKSNLFVPFYSEVVIGFQNLLVEIIDAICKIIVIILAFSCM